MENIPASSAPASAEATPLLADHWLNRNVLGMGLASFLADASYEMATAVLAGFLTALGAPPYALGVIEGVADAVSSWIKLGAGWWSDRLGRRKLLAVVGYGLTGVSKALFALAQVWSLVLCGRVLGWLGRGLRGPPRDALLAASVSATDRGKAFGFHRASDTLGAIVGPLAGAGLLGLLAPQEATSPSFPFRIIFVLTLLPGLGAALAFALLVRELPCPQRARPSFWASVRALPVPFRRWLLGVGVFGLGDFSHTLLLLAATQLLAPAWGLEKATSLAALLYAWRNTLYAAASYPIGALSDRLSRQGLLRAGYALAVLVMVGFASTFANALASLGVLAGLFALAGVYIAIEDTLEGALTADLVPDPGLRGTAYGVLGTVNGLGDLVSSVAVGWLWSAFGPVSGFLWAAGWMTAGLVLLQWVRIPPPVRPGQEYLPSAEELSP